MTDSTVIHSATERRLRNFLARPSHALILNAPAGTGKTSLALWLIGQIANQPFEKVTNLPYLKIVAPDGKSISIDEIRSLNQFLKLKTSGTDKLRRFVIIEQAEALTIEAQNAFLKLLEEPPADTLIILTANNTKALLPTLLSRAQPIAVQQPTKTQLEHFFKQTVDSGDFEKLYNLSAGRPGLLSAMINGEQEHPLQAAMPAAKKLLGASKFEQLATVDELSKRKDDNLILEALQLIADRSIAQAASQQNLKALKRWQKILSSTYETKTALAGGAQPKLALTNLILNL